MASLTFDDDLLAGFNFPDSTQSRVEAIIAAVDIAVDSYCKRNLAEATYNRVCPVLSNGDVHLRAYPVSRVLRILPERYEALTITSTNTIQTITTTTEALYLQHLSSGTLTPTTLTYATYPTLTELADAISGVSGFTSTVQTGYEDFPTTDLVSGIHSQNQSVSLPIYYGSGDYVVDEANGIIHLGYKAYNDIKVQWVGGYATYPADLKQVIAAMVGQAYDGKHGIVSSESFAGEYSYSITALDRSSIPVTNLNILDSYKDRSL